MRIAIIGSGIAGLTCAHVLGPHHDVVLFEADERLGGHANTVQVEDPLAGPLAIDTGFIVHNDRNYPNLVRLFDELDVPVQDTEMSFGVTDRQRSGAPFTYRATSLATLFGDRRNIVRPEMWRMLIDIARFYRAANKLLAADDSARNRLDDQSLGDFLREGRYSRAFIDLHLIPMGASVWSADPATFDAFPLISLLRFLSNHGLLGVGNRPQWRTVTGGSRTYVDALIDRFPGEVRLSSPVTSIVRSDADVRIDFTTHGSATTETFDRVILACHSDQALGMLEDASPAEKEVLGAIRYQPNDATLHTDTSVLSPVRSAWSAWNYDRPAGEGRATLTYDMTDLQRLPGSRRYLVSLNSDDRIDPAQVLGRYRYAHPVFDGPAIAAQARFADIDGAKRTHFCGAYWSYGFHEDGIASGRRVCERLGVPWG